MTIILSGREMTSRKAAHDHLARQLSLPDYYGRNLDALYDLLTERGEETLLVVTESAAITEALGDYGNALLDTLRDAALNNPSLNIQIP